MNLVILGGRDSIRLGCIVQSTSTESMAWRCATMIAARPGSIFKLIQLSRQMMDGSCGTVSIFSEPKSRSCSGVTFKMNFIK